MKTALHCFICLALLAPAAAAWADGDTNATANAVARKILPAADAPDELGDGWRIAYPELANAVDYLAGFERQGARALDFKPAAPPGLTAHAFAGGHAPDQIVIVNGSDQPYEGKVWLSGAKRGAVAYAPVWAAAGAAWLPQFIRPGETSLHLTLPAGGAVALRPALVVSVAGQFEAEVPRIDLQPERMEAEFQMDKSLAAAVRKARVTIFLEPRAQLLHIHFNGRGEVSFAPNEGMDVIRRVPIKPKKFKETNVVEIDFRPLVWLHIDPARLEKFPFYRTSSSGEARPKTWICVDDEASESDRRMAQKIARVFAVGGRPPLPVVTRAEADGVAGPPPKGGPNRISLGPRDSLLFPSFGFEQVEKRHVYNGGAVGALAEDPDGYMAVYLAGRNDRDREQLVMRFLAMLKKIGAIE